MKPSEIITITCKVLELDESILVTPAKPQSRRHYMSNDTRQKQKYCDGRFIITYLIRLKHDKDYSYMVIAEMLGQYLKTGKGDASAAIYSDWIAGQLIRSKNKEFIAKLEKVKKATSL